MNERCDFIKNANPRCSRKYLPTSIYDKRSILRHGRKSKNNYLLFIQKPKKRFMNTTLNTHEVPDRGTRAQRNNQERTRHRKAIEIAKMGLKIADILLLLSCAIMILAISIVVTTKINMAAGVFGIFPFAYLIELLCIKIERIYKYN